LVAEAVPAPNAIRAIAATAARPRILRYFIISPLVRRVKRRASFLVGLVEPEGTLLEPWSYLVKNICVCNETALFSRGADLPCGSAPEGGDRIGIALGLKAGAFADQVGKDRDGPGVAEGGEAV
jgi:hypothetical protein